MTAWEGSRIRSRVHVERGIRIPTRDGIHLAADLYRPAKGDGTPDPSEALPTIVERTPYDRTRQFMYECGQYFASRGYAWLAVDCRGRYDSEGTFDFFFDPHNEGNDGYDTVEWVAGQDWSDGKVGTTGLSFAGANQQATAVTRPPHLTTQVISDCGYNYWRRPLRNNGAYHLCGMAPYVVRMAMTGHEAAEDPAIAQALADFLRDMGTWIQKMPLRRGATPLALAPTYEDWFLKIVHHGDYDAFRTPMLSLQDHITDYPDIPVCFLAGWYGMRHAWANLEKFRILSARNSAPVKLVLGPWLHNDDFMEQSFAGAASFGNSAYVNLNDFRLRWFDQFLKGLDAGEREEPSMEVFVMGGGSGRRGTLDGRLDHGGRWKALTAWPAEENSTPLFLHRDGRLLDSAPSQQTTLEYVFDPEDPVPTIGGGVTFGKGPIDTDLATLTIGGGYDQRGGPGFIQSQDGVPLSDRMDVLVFRSDPLDSPVEVTGDVYVDLWVSSSARDTDFTVKLVDQYPPSDDYPEGFALNVTDEIMRMSYRNGRATRSLIEPGAVYQITFGPLPISNLFQPGHRIRLDVSSSNFPQFDVNPNTGDDFDDIRGSVIARNTVHLGGEHGSRIRLPKVAPR